MRIVAAAAGLLTAMGCAASPPAENPAAGGDIAACDAGRAQHLVGRAASAELAGEAQRLSGARVTRWLSPGQIVTMEYRADRLSIVLDGTNKVSAIRCG